MWASAPTTRKEHFSWAEGASPKAGGWTKQNPAPEDRGEVNRGTTLIAKFSHLSCSVSGAPAGVLLRMLGTGCKTCVPKGSHRPLLSSGRFCLLGSSLQKPILQLFYHKLRQCQPLSRNFTKNSIFPTAPPRAAQSSSREPSWEASPGNASAVCGVQEAAGRPYPAFRP